MFRLLNQNQVDAVLTLDKHIYHAEYVIAREERVSIHFIAAPDHPLCSKKKTAFEELVCQPFILTEKGMSYRRIMDEMLAGISLKFSLFWKREAPSLSARLSVREPVFLFFLTMSRKKQGKREESVISTQRNLTPMSGNSLSITGTNGFPPQMESVLSYCSEREFS